MYHVTKTFLGWTLFGGSYGFLKLINSVSLKKTLLQCFDFNAIVSAEIRKVAMNDRPSQIRTLIAILSSSSTSIGLPRNWY